MLQKVFRITADESISIATRRTLANPRRFSSREAVSFVATNGGRDRYGTTGEGPLRKSLPPAYLIMPIISTLGTTAAYIQMPSWRATLQFAYRLPLDDWRLSWDCSYWRLRLWSLSAVKRVNRKLPPWDKKINYVEEAIFEDVIIGELKHISDYLYCVWTWTRLNLEIPFNDINTPKGPRTFLMESRFP